MQRLTLTVGDVALLYLNLEHADAYYRKNGEPTGEIVNVRIALRHLMALHRRTRLRDFGPAALREVRDAMISAGLVRRSINIHVCRIRRMFKWAVEHEYCPVEVWQALCAVSGLREGRSKAKESKPIEPVAAALVDCIEPQVSPPVRAMVRLPLATGMRPGEVIAMRGCDLNMSGRVWEYVPGSHKTQHHGKRRIIFLGPKAQAIVREFLKPDLQAYLFSPKDGRAAFVGAKYRADAKRTGKGNRTPGDRYTTCTYANAIQRGCEKAFGMPPELRNPTRGLKTLPEDQRDTELERRKREAFEWRREHCWHPHQLRHTAATAIRREADPDTARTVLGHSSLNVAEVYAERDLETARRIVERIGSNQHVG